MAAAASQGCADSAFNKEKFRFEVSVNRVDIWEPAEPKIPEASGSRPMVCEIGEALEEIGELVPSSRTVRH